MQWLRTITMGLLLGLPFSLVEARPVSARPTHAAKKPNNARRQVSARRTQRKPHEHKRSDAVFPENVESTPAYRYAQLDEDACYREVETRKLAAHRVMETHPGIRSPMRLTGPLGTVTFRTNFRDEDGGPSVYSLIDCRLVLALHDFSTLLESMQVEEVLFSSSYRPPPKSTKPDTPGRRHSGGLAMDIHQIKFKDLGWLSVEKDFHGSRGKKVCGRGAVGPAPATKEAQSLRKLVCTASDRRYFQSILTPNYDRPHRNHFHVEVTPEVRWFMVN